MSKHGFPSFFWDLKDLETKFYILYIKEGQEVSIISTYYSHCAVM